MSSNPEIKVLVADDEHSILDLFKLILESIGVIPLLAENGEEAFDLYLQEKPTITFSDIHMPKVNGLMLLRKIKEVNSESLVILFTGYSHYRQIVDNLHLTPDGYLEKPFGVRDIIEIMLYHFPQLRK